MITQPFKPGVLVGFLHSDDGKHKREIFKKTSALKKTPSKKAEALQESYFDKTRIKISTKRLWFVFNGTESPVAGRAPLLPLQRPNVAPPPSFERAPDWLTRFFCDVTSTWALYPASHYQKRTISLSTSRIPNNLFFERVPYLSFFSKPLYRSFTSRYLFPRFYLNRNAVESEHATRLREKLALFVHSFDLLGFFVARESMGAQISKNGAKEETAAEKPSEAANKSNGQVIIIFDYHLWCCIRVVFWGGVQYQKSKSAQLNNAPINKGTRTLHWKSTLSGVNTNINRWYAKQHTLTKWVSFGIKGFFLHPHVFRWPPICTWSIRKLKKIKIICLFREKKHK